MGDLLGHGDKRSVFQNDRFVKPLRRLHRNPILVPEQSMGQELLRHNYQPSPSQSIARPSILLGRCALFISLRERPMALGSRTRFSPRPLVGRPVPSMYVMCCPPLSAVNEATIGRRVNAQAVQRRDAKPYRHRAVNNKLEAERSPGEGLSEWATSCAWFMTTGGWCHTNLARPSSLIPRSLLQFFNNRRERWNVLAPRSCEKLRSPELEVRDPTQRSLPLAISGSHGRATMHTGSLVVWRVPY